MSYKSQEYECDLHGRFEATVPREDDEKPQPCPDCGEPSEWRISGPMGKMAMGGISFVKGKSEGPERPTFLNTSALADGMKTSAFRKHRTDVWRQHRLRQLRQNL